LSIKTFFLRKFSDQNQDFRLGRILQWNKLTYQGNGWEVL